MQTLKALSKEQVRSVIEGRGAAPRIPMMYHFWTNPAVFADPGKTAELLSRYPQDVQTVDIHIPQLYDAPADCPSYRWSYMDEPVSGRAYDNAGFLTDWDSQLDLLLNDFPSPEYPGLTAGAPAADGRYRLGVWWYFFFERFWSMRGMENALADFYENPECVHALFDKLCGFYERTIDRCAQELQLDGIFTSDDLGTQTDVFFSPAIFDEFFYPYYKRVIDRAHSHGMHFWLHTCGNIEKFLPRFIDMGLDVIHPIQKYTMEEKHIADTYQDRITIWSGFDVQRTIPYGTPEDVRREVRHLKECYSRPEGRFMITLGNSATKDTPYESLKALLEETVK